MKTPKKAVIALDGPTLTKCLSNRRMHLILLPTEACNFRCVYCYETFQYKRMEPWVVEGVKRLLERRMSGLDVLELSWFGGEPLLAADIIQDVLAHAGTLAKEHGVRLTSSMTTNAYLLKEDRFRSLLSLGLKSYQISFDGPREYHDRKRVLAGGRGTFDRIWTNVLAMKREPGEFDVLIRVHADRQNVGALPEFIDQYRDTFGTDSRFTLFIRPLSRLGGPQDAALEILDGDESDRVIASLREYAGQGGIQQGPFMPEVPICYASMGNSFIVRSNGRLNKCTVALEHPANQVGMIRRDGTLEISTPKTLAWMRGLESGDTEELTCPMAGLADAQGSGAVPEDILLVSPVTRRVPVPHQAR
jgi:uncharacterized protein